MLQKFYCWKFSLYLIKIACVIGISIFPCLFFFIYIEYSVFLSSIYRQGHLPMVILLIQHGADPALIDGEGFSSIHLAVLFQHMPIIAYLISKGQVCFCNAFYTQLL